MSGETCEVGDMHQRILKLENESRRLKQTGVVALLLVGAFLLTGQASPKKVVEADEFILKDAGGNVRARLRMGGDFFQVPELELVDEKGTVRMRLRGGYDRVGGAANFSGVSVFDEHGKERGLFDADENGAALAFINVNGTDDGLVRAEGIMVSGPVTVTDDQGFQGTLGTTDLVTSRTGEKHRTSAASLVFFDKQKNVIWKAP
ncbi:MAG: hypothetical protein WAM69_01975 [Candidatus Sulfotelmatobacter sp.]